ncbi:unnamed protein product [Rotaria socialis]|uniref:Uncharacterized protein n=1 Tax=Rotaria socialis TaxID=392032 RepID=A0A820UI58_9BILA|nr:unnamed protein product [Rotaria socialis]CAF4483281.1 unnamed protein product [Rotaria socialis]CAF4671346.1 unnamed protein product [Rotaria socialis]
MLKQSIPSIAKFETIVCFALSDIRKNDFCCERKEDFDLTECITLGPDSRLFSLTHSKVCWGIAITGLIDEDKVCLPVRLTVAEWDEPCVANGMEARDMIGKVTVQALTAGTQYILLRYSSYVDVPTVGNATAFLSSNYASRHDFTAQDYIYVYEDPIPINSNGSTYYRCVANPLAT